MHGLVCILARKKAPSLGDEGKADIREEGKKKKITLSEDKKCWH